MTVIRFTGSGKIRSSNYDAFLILSIVFFFLVKIFFSRNFGKNVKKCLKAGLTGMAKKETIESRDIDEVLCTTSFLGNKGRTSKFHTINIMRRSVFFVKTAPVQVSKLVAGL